MITKKLLPTNDLYMQFTGEELRQFNMAPGDKFEIRLQDDSSIKLEKYAQLEIDLADWPVELLHILIKESCERDVSVNEIIVDFVSKGLEKLDLNTDKK